MDIAAAAQQQLDLLRAAGVRASMDPADINAPAVLLRPPTLTGRFGKGGYEAAWEAWAVVPDNGIGNALVAFSALLPKIQDAWTWPAQTIRPDQISMPDGSTLPAYVITYTTRIDP